MGHRLLSTLWPFEIFEDWVTLLTGSTLMLTDPKFGYMRRHAEATVHAETS